MKLIANNLTKSFAEKEVLQSISLEAQSGQAMGLLGRNGAGKTTTIRIIMGVFPGDSGQITIDGEKINRDKFKIGYLPEERGLYPKKEILEQMTYLGVLKGMNSKDARKSSIKWLERLGMTEYTNKKLTTLSKGNQQKIQLAATLVSNPDIVILDEPFSGLDPVNAMLLKDVVKELIVEDKIVLFSSHQMNYIEEFCDNIAILNKGKIVLSGNLKEIKRSYDRSKMVVLSTQQDKIEEFCKTSLNKMVVGLDRTADGLMIQLDSASKKNEFLSLLSQQNYDIDGMYVYEPSLNDIFVEYTED
ncbi:MAG: transporter ATP-binding protein [Clostridiales bacterium]|jgi:ABC-2 type transport system ATP-binding protein|nr:transporter ATP-binding protein [Clostridiales bacterium]